MSFLNSIKIHCTKSFQQQTKKVSPSLYEMEDISSGKHNDMLLVYGKIKQKYNSSASPKLFFRIYVKILRDFLQNYS